MSLSQLTHLEVIDRLVPLISDAPDGGVVFDADGTLWSHDVGCMVFDYACEQDAFLPEARDALVEFAERRDVSMRGITSASDAARAVNKAFYAGQFDEREAAELQVWAYVGHTRTAFDDLVTSALRHGKHTETLHKPVLEIAEWCRSRNLRTLVVSASPQWVVEGAAGSLGFASRDIAAGLPNTTSSANGSTIAPGMNAPLPYGPDKVTAGRALLDGATWLAALGDSDFDLEMMGVAKLACGIGSKPRMLQGLSELGHGVQLTL